MKRKPEYNIASSMGRIVRLLDHKIEELLEEKSIDLSKMQFITLNVVYRNQGVSQNELALFADRDKSSLTRMINTLERKNYLYRTHTPEDKRVNHISITEEGARIVTLATPIFRDLASLVEKGLSDEEIEFTKKILDKIKHNIDNG
jgi:DNA-binding MarR family transcriptional regulator